MKISSFNASCPFEIGDKVKDITGKIMTITDIVCVHYLKKQTVGFYYEFDACGDYKAIKQLDLGENHAK